MKNTKHQHTSPNITLPTDQKAAVYSRQAVADQSTMGKDLRELNTQLLLKFARDTGWADDNLIMFNDTGIPATAPLEKREGLQALITAIEHDEVKMVLLRTEQSLYRDAHLVDIAFLIELFKRHCVFIATPQLVYDLTNPMHERLFRFSLESQAFGIFARTNAGKRYKKLQQEQHETQ